MGRLEYGEIWGGVGMTSRVNTIDAKGKIVDLGGSKAVEYKNKAGDFFKTKTIRLSKKDELMLKVRELIHKIAKEASFNGPVGRIDES